MAEKKNSNGAQTYGSPGRKDHPVTVKQTPIKKVPLNPRPKTKGP